MNKKKGFTLSEVLVVLALLGIIAVLCVVSLVSQKSAFGFSCYVFYRDIKIAIGHMGASTYNGGLNSFSCEDALLTSQEAYTNCILAGKGLSTSNYLMDYRTNSGFCNALAKFLSAVKTKCEDTDLNDASLDNPYGSFSSSREPNIYMNNRQLIYVSSKITPERGLPYRIITVDINGPSRLNIKGGDVVSFAVFNNGEVLPLGTPATSTDHFTTVIKMKNIYERPASQAEAVTQSVRHPAAIIRTANKKRLSFKDAYCRALGSSEEYPDYCSSYTTFSEKFKFSSSLQVPVSICLQNQYKSDGTPAQKVGEYGFVAECEFNIVKPSFLRFIPTNQDVYSSLNNKDDIDSGTGKANKIYKY